MVIFIIKFRNATCFSLRNATRSALKRGFWQTVRQIAAAAPHTRNRKLDLIFDFFIRELFVSRRSSRRRL